MRIFRNLGAGSAILALVIVLAACAQVPGGLPSEEPSEQPSGNPTAEPAPSEAPEPSEEPGPSEPPESEVFRLPMVGRVTEDGLVVRESPSHDAPPLTGESFADPDSRPEIELGEGDEVIVTLGPLFVDGEAWYEVEASQGGDVYWVYGWVPGDALERVGDAPNQPVITSVHGQGTDEEGSVDVIVGTPVTVRFAATPGEGAESCEIDVTVIRSDDLGVNVATETVTETRIVQLDPQQLSSLFQEEPGTVTLEVASDCNFAAIMMTPQS